MPFTLKTFERSFLLLAVKGIQRKQTLILTFTGSFTHMHMYVHVPTCTQLFWFGALHLLFSPNPSTPPNHLVPCTKPQGAEDLGPFHKALFSGNWMPLHLRGERAKEGRSSLWAPCQDNLDKYNMRLKKWSDARLVCVQSYQVHPMPQDFSQPLLSLEKLPNSSTLRTGCL